MQTRRLFLSVFGAGLLLAGSLAHAAQLDGLEIEPSGEKVQIILDTDASQAVQVDRQEGSQTTLFLPKAKLPKAFQGTGLPPIHNNQAGVTAEVQETPEGLCIYLNSAKQSRNFYEIGFKRNQAPPPTVETTKPSLPKPTDMGKNPIAPAVKYHVKGNLPLAKAPAKPLVKAAQIATAPAAAKPVVKARPIVPAKSATPVAKMIVPPKVATQPALATPKPVVVESKTDKSNSVVVVREAETIPGQPEIITEIPESEEQLLAQSQQEEQDAYALMQQAQEEQAAQRQTRQHNLEKTIEHKQPGALSWFGAYWGQAKGLLFSSVSRWIFASILLLGVFLFIASFAAVWFKKRIVDRATIAYELPPDIMSPAPERPEKDFFEAPPEVAAPEPETFDAYLAEPQPEAWSPPPQAPVEAARPVDTVHPTAPQSILAEETGSLLFSPPKSYGEAIKSSLQSHASPNVSAPFKPVKPEISTEGGPKTKRNGGKNFNQYLKR